MIAETPPKEHEIPYKKLSDRSPARPDRGRSVTATAVVVRHMKRAGIVQGLPEESGWRASSRSKDLLRFCKRDHGTRCALWHCS